MRSIRLDRRYILLLLVLLALTVRSCGLGHIKKHTGDESMHISNAMSYVETGVITSNWSHPPLRHILQYCSIKILGDNPYGWRGVNVLFGTLSILIIFLLAKELFDNERVAALSSIFLLIDPLHIMFSRTTFEEIPGGFFIMAAVYSALRYLRGSTLAALAAGLCFGLSFATKWYYLPAWVVVTCFIIYRRYAQGNLGTSEAMYVFAAFFILPAAVYLSTFHFWFARGYGMGDFLSMQADSFKMLEGLNFDVYETQNIRMLAVPVWQWFLKPVVIGYNIWIMGAFSLSVVFMNSPIVWLLTIPSVTFVTFKSIMGTNANKGLMILLFAFTYAQFCIINRPMFFYSLLSVLPFAYLCIALFLSWIIETHTKNTWHFRALIVLSAVLGIYLLPLAVVMPYPTFLYKPVFAFSNMVSSF
ncbi:glycosyltransferase family 39 protein [Nitrospirota bacterium]